jgi:hypothetical protein
VFLLTPPSLTFSFNPRNFIDPLKKKILIYSKYKTHLFLHTFCLFICFESHEQFFSYLATVTIAGDRAANLDLCLALTAFSSEVLLRATPTATRDLRF